MDLLLGDHVIVVQDQHKCSRGCPAQQIEKRRQDVREWRGLWRLQILEQCSKAFGLLLIQGREDIGPEEPWFIIFLVQRDPGNPRMAGCRDWAQLESNMVLPKPAGAETSVKGYFRLSSSKPMRRGREIREPGEQAQRIWWPEAGSR